MIILFSLRANSCSPFLVGILPWTGHGHESCNNTCNNGLDKCFCLNEVYVLVIRVKYYMHAIGTSPKYLAPTQNSKPLCVTLT